MGLFRLRETVEAVKFTGMTSAKEIQAMVGEEKIIQLSLSDDSLSVGEISLPKNGYAVKGLDGEVKFFSEAEFSNLYERAVKKRKTQDKEVDNG